MDIINHKLEKTDNGYIVYLYLDPYQEEFSSEFLTNIKDKQKNIHEMVDQYIKGRLSGVKIITANIVIGATLLTSIPIGPAVEAHDASFNMSYLYFGNTATAINAVDETNGNLDVISPSYFDLESDGTLKLTSMLDPLFIDEMHKRGIKVVPFLSNHWDREKGRAALNNREELANQIANAIIEYNLDGVNIDIENVTEIDRNNYTDFVRLISEKLPDDKEVSVAIAANPNQWSKGWHGSYDNNQLAKYADYLMLMAYDEHYQGGQAGPVASINWVDKSIETLVVVEGVPPEKVVLGLPFFGRYWNSAESTGGYGASNHQIESLIVKYNGKTTFDTESQSPKATFTLTEGDPPSIIAGRTLKPGTYEVWYENNQSIEAKIDLVHKYNLKGTGSWSLGQENPTVWENFGIWLSEHNADSVSGSYQTTSSFPFHDVSNNYWARDEILYVNQKGWFKGIDDITFAPQEKITRAQAAAVLVRSLDLEALKPLEDSFSDVSRNYWAKESIEIAKQHGIFLGKQDGTFGPNEKLTREHMAVLLDRLFHEYYDFEKTNDPVYFKDVPRDKWSYDAIASTNQQGIFKGIDKYTFKPEDTVTRAQMAAALTRSADRVSKLKGEQLFSNMLKIDSQGADVVLLQIYLKNVDLGNITVTGKFDNETANAVRVFQQKNNLSVDGIVGPETSQKLIDVKISYR